MKVFTKLIFFVFLLSATGLSAQSLDDFGIKFSGFVKTDAIFDSRGNTSIREGHFLLYPLPEQLDPNGDDINEHSQFSIFSIQSRLAGTITGPDVLGAKSSGRIEGAFFGSTDATINTFRLRHAFVKLDWENTTFLAGQTWNIMFVEQCFPGVVSFNTGAPFQPFARNPQLRLTQRMGGLTLDFAAMAQRDFTNTGPVGGSHTYLKNAVIPDLGLRATVNLGTNSVLGVVGEYKMLKPRIQTTAGYKTDELVSSYAAMGFMKLWLDPVTIKMEGVYGQNLTNVTMLGGYGVSAFDPETMQETYTPTNTMSAWADISTGKKVEVGLFVGYSKNMGFADDLEIAPNDGYLYWARGANIDQLLRVSPRVVWNINKVRFAGEIEYTSAAYGTPDAQDKFMVKDTETYANIRGLIACYIFF